MIKASIIIPAYNAADCIADAVASAFSGSGSDREVIVIDDGSTDGTAEAACSADSRVLVELGGRSGAASARNRGLARAQGKWIKFLDADDVLIGGALQRQLDQAQSLGENVRGILYGDALWVDAAGRQLKASAPRPRLPRQDPVLHILTQSPLTSCPLHRRDLLQEVGGFDERLTKGQEHDLHLRLVLAGVDFVYRPGRIYRYRNDTSSVRISSRVVKNGDPLEHLNTIRRHCALIIAARGCLSRPVSRALGRRLWSLGRAVLREGYRSAAEEYFVEAIRLAGPFAIAGRVPYPQLAWALGAERTERLMDALRRWRDRFA